MEFLIAIVCICVLHVIVARWIRELGRTEWREQRAKAIMRRREMRRASAGRGEDLDVIARFVRYWQK